jgi:hypothetical protein
MANGNRGGNAGVIVGLGLSNTALAIGAAAAIGLGVLAVHRMHQHRKIRGVMDHKKAHAYAAAAADQISPDGVEDLLFQTILENADRSQTVLDNEDRIREHIDRMKPIIKKFIDNYKEGRLTYKELETELKAISMQTHMDLQIPIKFGREYIFHPDVLDHPAHHGHRELQWNPSARLAKPDIFNDVAGDEFGTQDQVRGSWSIPTSGPWQMKGNFEGGGDQGEMFFIGGRDKLKDPNYPPISFKTIDFSQAYYTESMPNYRGNLNITNYI